MISMRILEARYHAIAEQLRAPKTHVLFTTIPQHDGSPHVELATGCFSYVVTERGEELERRTTRDPDELLYWLVSDLTRAMASKYELKHRVPHEDFRRLLFKKHLELLADVSRDWSERKRQEYDRILDEHPFYDHD